MFEAGIKMESTSKDKFIGENVVVEFDKKCHIG